MPDRKNDDIIIAIDGPSSSGKSTLAKDLAKRLSYRYIDSGAMYRAVTVFLLRQEISYQEIIDWDFLHEKVQINFSYDNNTNFIFLNGENVSEDIRSPEVNEHVSLVAALSPIRSFLVSSQQVMGKDRRIVMDGRDIGSVVFPDAELKIFLEASFKIRAKRRYAEQQIKGIEQKIENVEENLQLRDFIDSNRKDSPLIKADGAFILNNDALSLAEQLDICYELAMKKITA